MEPFPYIIDAKDLEVTDHLSWLISEREHLQEKLKLHAGILLRNFPIRSRQDLERFVEHLVQANSSLDYTGGTSPREKMGKNIYSSTKMPFFLKIPLHSEMAYRQRFPKKVIFFCETAPLLGGETPIVDLRRVDQDIPQRVREKLRSGITYYRHLHNYTPLRKFLARFNPMVETGTWQFVFQTSDPEVVNRYCRENHYKTNWLPDGSVMLTTTLPSTFHGLWFNSAHFFQVHHRIWGRLLTPLYKFILLLSGGKNLSARAGTGEALTSSEISSIVDAYEKNEVKFKWRKGDVLYLDNTLTAHGRSPYLGKRKILVSLAEEGEFTSLPGPKLHE